MNKGVTNEEENGFAIRVVFCGFVLYRHIPFL
jgi:hypothetical protein